MSACWGTGPFDSDEALDYLADIAAGAADLTTSHAPVPGTVNASAARAGLAAGLHAVTLPEDEDEYRPATCHAAYAAAGLVAAAHTGQDTTPGTRSREDREARWAGDRTEDPHDPLGLGAHCGFLTLLDPATAAQLRPAARDAVAALAGEDDWLSLWIRPEVITVQLDRLALLLA